MTNPADDIETLRAALRTALEKWREADWHWTMEFGPVPPTAEEHVPEDEAEWQRLRALAYPGPRLSP